ncbi:hypothetical protein [Parabacteroides johnsonii]|uniref:hypothetical protein n=1 Tax=Parabacteroides johnsonii TaxID=387661 RepID=UPI0011DE3E6C|nr:hypothetical protein [Parabacteroides johnsonii]
MQTKQYDLTGFNNFLNTMISPSEMCHLLVQLAFEHVQAAEDGALNHFKDNMSTIELMYDQFYKLAEQE